MYIPKDINKNLKEEAKRAGRTNRDGMVVAPAWSKLFTQADYVVAKQANEIERLRLANSDLKMHYDHARTECDKLLSEVLRLRGSLAFISMLTPLDGQSWESHAKFINAYAINQLEEEE